MNANTFEASLVAVPAPLGPWEACLNNDISEAFEKAAQALGDMPDGMVLAEGLDVCSRFRGDLTIRYVGACEGRRGESCDGYLFNVSNKLEVIAWVADDDSFSRVRWRGDEAILSRLTIDILMFRDLLI